jgi:Type II secretion system (T2SS), protein E, N-terminal domain
MSENENPTHFEDQARELAAQWGLEFRAAAAIVVDPRALSLLPGDDCRRLRAVPLSTDSGALVAVDAPSEERLAAVRELTGTQTRFVVIAEKALDTLLHSRMFASRPLATTTVAPAATTKLDAESLESAALLLPAPAPAPRPVATDAVDLTQHAAYEHQGVIAPSDAAPVESRPQALDQAFVDAIVDALELRLASAGVTRVAEPSSAMEPETERTSVSDLLSQIDASIGAWSTLRTTLQTLSGELDTARRNLRETKEQLSVAHAENDQNHRRVRSLEAEVEESRAHIAEARARLQDAAEALGAPTRQLDELPAELL